MRLLIFTICFFYLGTCICCNAKCELLYQGKHLYNQKIDCKSCIDTVVVLETMIKKKADIKESFVYQFLLCFTDLCKNNVELSEYSNEVLFLLLKEYPKLSLNTFSIYKKRIPWKNICDKIAHPINDIINIKEILKDMDAIIGYDNVKKDVINALKEASDKM